MEGSKWDREGLSKWGMEGSMKDREGQSGAGRVYLGQRGFKWGSVWGREGCIYRNRVFAVSHSILLLGSVSDMFGWQKEEIWQKGTKWAKEGLSRAGMV